MQNASKCDIPINIPTSHYPILSISLLADLLPQCHHPARLLPGTVWHDLIAVTRCDPRLIGPAQGHEARRALYFKHPRCQSHSSQMAHMMHIWMIWDDIG